MRNYTYLRPDGGMYESAMPQSPTDIAIADKPSGHYLFDRDKMAWLPDFDAIEKEYEQTIDERLEDFARELYSKGYANAVTYINSSVKEFRLEAEYLVRLRDETWPAAFAFLSKVKTKVLAGELAMPGIEEVFAVLPTPSWPEGSRGYVK